MALIRAKVIYASGQLEAGAEYCDAAMEAFDEMAASLMRAEALLLRGQIHAALGRADAAREAWQAGFASLSSLHLRTTVRLSQEIERQLSSLTSDGRQTGHVE